MRAHSGLQGAGLSRRDIFITGSATAAGLASGGLAGAASATMSGPDVYTRIGVRPFINCTATLTINGGSQMLPEVISTIEQASHYHVNLDELMEKVSARLAELLQVEWGIVTGGTAAALTHATAACIVGTDPEKMQRLPSLAGLKDEVIVPRESRNAYDHAIRTLGVKIIEVNSPDEVRAAVGPHTAMIEILGNHFGGAKLDLKDVAPIARKAGIPVLVDAAADYLIVPNPYLALGADLVAYSGGKIIRGPQSAGLLLGRRDLVRAAWANSAPHHAFGRALKVSKENVVGMLRAVEIWRTQRDIQTDFREWESWYAEMIGQLTKVAGVRAEVRPPARGGPFSTLDVSWDPKQIGMTAREVGRLMLEGEPRIMTHAEGEGHSFLIRPAALKPGEYKIVATRLAQVLSATTRTNADFSKLIASPADISGVWDVDIQYEVGSSHHKLFLNAKENRVAGSHEGWAYHGDLTGEIDGNHVRLRSSLPAEGQRLSYTFTGTVSGNVMSGGVDVGEYGKGQWSARWHAAAV
ncbi:MAG: aminotransferase class V-fold PLP-dependent enzyme [Acidobacteriota bacterium]|nr:aminotransferase class V-fold PLP-dependent enzyme [Acidobacteriota bacterium]